jgi:uncharacterized protein YjbI with pentapeptide repeats
MRFKLTFATLVLPLACQVESQPLPSASTCVKGGRSYGSFATGGALCDNQHLVASLSPLVVDIAAGKGALDVPLKVTRTESRDYCFIDDNGEGHKLVIRNESGMELVRLKAGDACARTTLEEGNYTTRIEHEKPGEVDTSPDVVHSRLVDRDGVPSLVFEVNACPDCQLVGLQELPCWGQNAVDDYAYCGLRGNYTRATVDAICTQAAGIQPRTNLPYNVVCSFFGSFGGATLNIRFGYLGSAGNWVQLGSSERQSDFGGADLGPLSVPRDSTLAINNVLQLSGKAPVLQGVHVENASPGTLVDRGYFRAFNQAASFRGGPFIHRTSTLSLTGELLDYSRVVVYPLQQGGFPTFEGVNFGGATIRNMPPLRDGSNPFSYRGANFRGATIEDSQVDATILDNADFTGAKLRNVTFRRAPDRRVSGNGVRFDQATLDRVVFGEERAAGPASSIDFDLSNASFDRSNVRALTFHNTELKQATFVDATISRLAALRSDLTAVDLDVAAAGSLDVSYSVFNGTVRIAHGSTRRLDAFTAIESTIRTPFSGWTFTNASLRGTTLQSDFAGAQFIDSDLSRATFDCPKKADGTCDASGGSYDGMRFTGATNMTSAMVVWSMKDANFDGVTLSGAIFLAPLAASTFNRGIVSGARFCGTGDNQSYTGLTFSNVNMSGLVMPALGSAYPVGPTTDFVCQGGISATSRDGLRTATALRCANGQPPVDGDCKGTVEWQPLADQVRTVCCDPGKDPNCNQLNRGKPCVANCQCASLVCLASGTCQ